MNELYQQLILQHNKYPHSFEVQENYDTKLEAQNPLCGDEIDIYLSSPEEILSFYGNSCAIAKASASMMVKETQGLKIFEIKEKIREIVLFLKGETQMLSFESELKVFQMLENFPLRRKCALLSWESILKHIENKG